MSDNISIEGLDKAAVLAALYNNAQPQGYGFMHFDPKPMTVEEARIELTQNGVYFDYLKGRVMKVSLEEDSFSPRLYDRDNGGGSAARVIAELRTTGDSNPETTQTDQAERTAKMAAQAKSAIGKSPTVKTDGDVVVYTLNGLDDSLSPFLEEFTD